MLSHSIIYNLLQVRIIKNKKSNYFFTLQVKLLISYILFFFSPAQSQLLDLTWVNTLADSINRMQTNLQGNIERMNQQIQQNVRARLVAVDQLNHNIAEQLGKKKYNLIFFFISHYTNKYFN